jgi:hypothetical protein
MAQTSHFDSECLIRTDMGTLLGISSFSEAFRIQIGLAELLSGCPPSGNLESDRYRAKSVVGRNSEVGGRNREVRFSPES